ncbi:MAG: AAA family ATPase, partial [Anaerolineae bacterium]
MMRIQLLGSCQTFWQERPLSLPRRQTRALLYLLAARLEPVPRARIAFLFWPDEPDAVARRQLTRLLSSLRAALPRPDLLRVDEEAVALDPALVQSDSQPVLATRTAADSATLEAAVTLYRGPFMAGFDLPGAPEYEAWQAQTARQLEIHTLSLIERLVAHYTAAGDTPAAIRCAQRYLALDELAEAMHGRLIGLYVAAGDRAAAQRQYEQCALLLEQELGVSPLPETQAALRAGPIQRAPTSAWPESANSEPRLTGREAALAQIDEALQRLQHGGLILLHGAPGVGKTRLLREAASRHSGRMLVLPGRSYPGSQALPFHPLLQALRDSFAALDLWRTVPTAWLSELLPLLPDLRGLFPDLPAPLPAAPAHAQSRVLAALTQTLAALAR